MLPLVVAWFSCGSVTLSTSAFADDVIFPHNGSRGNVDLRVVLQQGVATFQRIRQGSPHCLTLSSYTITSNCAPGGKVCCSRLPSNTVERRDGRVGLAIKDIAGSTTGRDAASDCGIIARTLTHQLGLSSRSGRPTG